MLWTLPTVPTSTTILQFECGMLFGDDRRRRVLLDDSATLSNRPMSEARTW